MKKIFTAIIALAALVGCSTEANQVVAPAYLTTSMEVNLDSSSRAFSENLEWSWEATDKIAAYQLAGDNTVNELVLKTNGKFGAEKFVYATDKPSTFVFVYPYDAYISTEKVGFVQTGKWTPTLVGFVSDATVDNLGTVTMAHASAAFEIRVYEAGRATRKAISEVTISSTENFCNGTSATVSDINRDTVVFNIAQGTFPFEVTLTAADGDTYTVSKELTFEFGKRTVLNVEWKAEPVVEPTLSYTILSSYTNKDNSLDGRSIYVKDIVLTDADSATIELYLNGNKAADMTPGQTTTVSNLAVGEYKAVVKWSANGKEYTSDETKVYVTGIPYSFKFYQSNDAAVDGAGWTRNGASTKMELMTLKEGGLAGSDSGWIASPAYYAPVDGIATNVTLEAKYYVAAFKPSSSKAVLYVGATSSPKSSSSTASSLTLTGSNDTSSDKAWSTVSTGVNIPNGTQYVSINHNGATYWSGSRIYLCSYKIEYRK